MLKMQLSNNNHHLQVSLQGTMLDPEIDLVPQSSPSISSISSSDFDSESTGSFFHDRSTSLGTLMGVSFPSIRVSSHRDQQQQHNSMIINNNNSSSVSNEGERKKKKKKKKKKAVVVVETEKNRRWWKLCRDDVVKSASLADYLEVERRFDDGEYYGVAAEFESVVVRPSSSLSGNNGRLLFADGRVLPPTSASTTRTTEVVVPQTNAVAALCRFPVLITGICSGGGVSRGSGV